jgi:hypothetical protein
LVAAFNRHRHGDNLTALLTALQSAGLARCEKRTTGGRPAELWFATNRAATESHLMEISRQVFRSCDQSDESDQSHPRTPAPTPFRRIDRFCRTSGGVTSGFYFGGDEAVASAPPPPAPRVPGPAEVWLVNLLRSGPRSVEDVEAEAKRAGQRVPAVKMAAEKHLRILPYQGTGGCWYWKLPDRFDFGAYPTPPEPEPSTLVSDLPPPEPRPTRKDKRRKRKTAGPRATASNTSEASDTAPTADGVARLLRKHKRTWADVAALLDERGEYYPNDEELHGLTGPQLKLVDEWLTDRQG